MQIYILVFLITYMKKLLDSDWLRTVQLKSNTSAKSLIPVQIIQMKILEPDLQSTLQVSVWSVIEISRKLPITFERGVSEVSSISKRFRKFPKIFKNCRKIVLRTFRHFPIFTEDFRRFPTISTKDMLSFGRSGAKDKTFWLVTVTPPNYVCSWNYL